jgi:hypothetical protein
VRVSSNLEDVLVTMTFQASLFGKITGESGKVFSKPASGGNR